MGAWGYKTFENDDALDWMNDFLSNPSSEFLKATFESINNQSTDDYIEAFDASKALIAASTLAHLINKKVELPANFIDKLKEKEIKIIDEANLKLQAQNALKRILSNSELLELWSESEELDKWKETAKQLIEILT